MRVTDWLFWYSCVGSQSLPAGPLPLIPNRLLSLAASSLCPQADSSRACAIVTAVGTPYLCCVAMAPAAIWLMNACWVCVPGAGVEPGGSWCLAYGAVGSPGRWCVATDRPGMAAPPGVAARDRVTAVGTAVPGTRAVPVAPARVCRGTQPSGDVRTCARCGWGLARWASGVFPGADDCPAWTAAPRARRADAGADTLA